MGKVSHVAHKFFHKYGILKLFSYLQRYRKKLKNSAKNINVTVYNFDDHGGEQPKGSPTFGKSCSNPIFD
jgi:hypothetical protein